MIIKAIRGRWLLLRPNLLSLDILQFLEKKNQCQRLIVNMFVNNAINNFDAHLRKNIIIGLDNL